MPATDETTIANRIAGRSAIAALEGRTQEAIVGYGDAFARLVAIGSDFELARIGLDFVRLLGPTEPAAREAAERSRAIFERIGAKPYLALLHEALRPQRHLPSHPAASEQLSAAQ